MPQILKEYGFHTQLICDHLHSWEDGGAAYQNRYSCCEAVGGQESDSWKGDLRPTKIPNHIGGRDRKWGRQDWVNRSYMINMRRWFRCVDHSLERIISFMDEVNW